jgi:hypothetical protein
MKKFVYVVLILIVPSIILAGGLTFSQKRQLKDAGYSHSDIRKIERGQANVEPTYKYESFSGNRYKYDLSDPGDSLDYKLDIGAQLDDKINIPINPGVKMDRNFNQYGGGLMDD